MRSRLLCLIFLTLSTYFLQTHILSEAQTGLSPKQITAFNAVKVVGTKLFVNGKPYEVKHVGYGSLRRYEFPSEWGICTCDPEAEDPFKPFHCPESPTPGQQVTGPYEDPARIAYDLYLIKSLGANGIRTWAEVTEPLLDALAERDMKAAAGITLPWDDAKYTDPNLRKEEIDKIITSYIHTFKDHPALLIWLMGNEIELHIKPETIPDYFTFLEELAVAIKREDPNHPVATVVAFNPDLMSIYDAQLDEMDLWGVNAYPGETFEPQGKDSYWKKLSDVTQKPYYISEYGVDAFKHTNLHEDFTAGFEDLEGHAQITANLAQEIRVQVRKNYLDLDPEAQVIGGAIYTFNDQTWLSNGWWDACYEGIDQDGWRRPGHDVYDDLEYYGIYKNTPTAENPNKLEPRPLADSLRQVFSR